MLSKAAEHLVNRCGWHGMQGVRAGIDRCVRDRRALLIYGRPVTSAGRLRC
jgi:hypothetical protein